MNDRNPKFRISGSRKALMHDLAAILSLSSYNKIWPPNQEHLMLPINAKERRQDRILAGRVVSLALVLFVAGCAVAPPPPPPGAVTVSPVSVIGTPFLLAFKVPACAVTLALAGPIAAMQQLAAPTRDELDKDFRPELDAGIAENCGPPYMVMPY